MQRCKQCNRPFSTNDPSSNGICMRCVVKDKDYIRVEPTLHKCPYCNSIEGFTYNRTDKMTLMVNFEGLALDETVNETIYEHKTRRCINCDESITSYVKSLGLNI